MVKYLSSRVHCENIRKFRALQLKNVYGINACKGSLKTACDFEYSGNMIETILVGMAAYRAGKKIKYDSVAGKVIGDSEANALLSRKYRDGWTLHG